MFCQFCGKNASGKRKHIKEWSGIEEHLIITRDQNNHFHVHGPFSNKSLILQFIKHICKEAEIEIEVEA